MKGDDGEEDPGDGTNLASDGVNEATAVLETNSHCLDEDTLSIPEFHSLQSLSAVVLGLIF